MSQANALGRVVALVATEVHTVAARPTDRPTFQSVVTRAVPEDPAHRKDLAKSLPRDVVNYFAHDCIPPV
ncbi:MAG: hypothetical protein GY889_05550 [Proteobacteria bacterium]|nr:hypothetical protein [Pseudomonadota bacterium]